MAELADIREVGRRQGKSASAFRTISEVAGDLNVPPHVLRFWETKFTQVKPLKRGGGRRYYRPEDVDLLRGIRELLYTDGYTIKGVQKLLREGGVKTLARPTRSGKGRLESIGESSVRGVAGRVKGRDAPATDKKYNEINEILSELETLRDELKRRI